LTTLQTEIDSDKEYIDYVPITKEAFKIIELIRQGHVRSHVIANKLGVQKSTINTQLRRMHTEGQLLHMNPDRKNNEPNVWAVVDLPYKVMPRKYFYNRKRARQRRSRLAKAAALPDPHLPCLDFFLYPKKGARIFGSK
jgi:hypothetical protein